MTGSWHLYRPGEPWRRRASDARVAIETDAWVAVCFAAPVVELLASSAAVAAHPSIGRLGPDILADDFDPSAVVAGLRAAPEASIGGRLLVQRVVAGLGNIWRCETLWRVGVHPMTRVGDLSETALSGMIGLARKLMRRAIADPSASPAGSSVGRPVFGVHDRSGLPCPRCGDRVGVVPNRGSDPARVLLSDLSAGAADHFDWKLNCWPPIEASSMRPAGFRTNTATPSR
jgi:endonuclease-8